MDHLDFPEYQSYLLRLWQVQGEAGTDWRASLESAETGERLGFAGLDAMFDYLSQQTQSSYREEVTLNEDVTKR